MKRKWGQIYLFEGNGDRFIYWRHKTAQTKTAIEKAPTTDSFSTQ